MEAFGQLTGRILHDFNKLLAVIIGNLEILEEELPAAGIDDNEGFRALLGAAMSVSEKGAKLNKQLLAFSRRQAFASKSIDLNEQIAGMVDLLRLTLGETIAVEVVSEASLNSCDTDPVQVEAALLNLAINGRDAMPDGGTLTIELSNQELREQDVVNLDDAGAGPYVMLAVRDTGFSIAPENLEYVFEPFFTTKDVGQGSGLDLSMVFGFAKYRMGMSRPKVAKMPVRRSGCICCARMPFRRTRRRIASLSFDQVGKQSYLLRTIPKWMLLRPPSSRNLAIPYWKLLTVDQRTSGSAGSVLEGGTRFAEEGKIRVPGIKVLFMSGYPRDVITSKRNIDSGVQLLEKPFLKFLLARRLREANEN